MNINKSTISISTILLFALFLSGCNTSSQTTQTAQTPSGKYQEVQKKLKSGWGTFNNRNVLSHVLLPEGIALNIGMKCHHNSSDNLLPETIISRGTGSAVIRPGYKALDGTYSELTVTWQEMTFRVESATTNNQDLILLITPVKMRDSIPSLILGTGFLWNRPGTAQLNGNTISLNAGKKSLIVRTTGTDSKEYLSYTSPYLSVRFDKPVAFYTGNSLTMEQITTTVAQRRTEQENIYRKYGNQATVYQTLQAAIGWNIIYDASKDRVIFPVSRNWTEGFGAQYVLFDWDTYFGAMMAGLENKELAYANAVEITKSITPGGFIPNFTCSYGSASFDRSQPPVGSMVFNELYKRYKDKWLLEYVWDELISWNRWWPKNRDNDGLLCWGSTPVPPPLKSDADADSWQAAAFESGLDNSPMYDGVPFNKKTHLMEQADAGLTGMYIMDCDNLAEIAAILGKTDEEKELHDRADSYRKNLASLWDEKSGIFRNKRTDTNQFSTHISPTNFYPLLGKAATQQQAERMIKEHFLNEKEFYGEWMIPSISRDDQGYKSQDYWRGRIWGPMNFLVYLGLRNYDLSLARKILAEKSSNLLMVNANMFGYVFENYNANTGNINDPEEARRMGDYYYHWGALLGFIQLMEAGYWDVRK